MNSTRARWLPLALAALLTGLSAHSPACAQAAGQVVDPAELARYSRDLKSADAKERYEAAYALGEAGKEAAAAVPALIECLKDSDVDVRTVSASALGKIGQAATDHAAEIAALCKDRRAEVRNAAVEALGELTPPAPNSTAVLFDEVGDESEEVRSAAVTALGKICTASADLIPEVCRRSIALFSHGSAPLRTAAVQILGSLDTVTPEAVDALVGLLGSDQAEIRSAAVMTLSSVGSESVHAGVVARLLTDGRPATRAAAAELLAHLGRAAAPFVPDLVKALHDSDPHVRGEAGYAIKSVAPQDALTTELLIDLLACGDLSAEQWAASRLVDRAPVAGSAESRAMAERVAALVASGRSDVRAAAARVLARIGRDAPGAIPALVTALQDPESDVRKAAAVALGQEGLAALPAAPRVAELLKDARPAVRESAAFALQQIQPTATAIVSALCTALDDSDRSVHNAAFHALQVLSQEGVVYQPGLLVAFANDDSQVRRWATTSLETSAPLDRATVTRVGELTADRRPELRAAALGLLGRLKLPAEICAPAFTRALSDTDPVVRAAAANAFGANEAACKPYGLRAARLLLDPRPPVRAAAADALAQMSAVPPVSVGVLARLLRDPDREVRSRAAQAIASLNPLPAQTVAGVTLALKDTYPPVRYHAARALARSAASPVPVLLRALQDPDGGVRCAAATGLGERGAASVEVVPALTRALTDPEALVRRAAAEALSHIADEQSKAPRPGAKKARDDWSRAFQAADETLIALPHTDMNWDVRDRVAIRLRATIAAMRGDKPVRRGWEVGIFRGIIVNRPTPVDADDEQECEKFSRKMASPDADERAYAAYALAELGPAASAASPVLTRALNDSSPEVRGASACALGTMQLYEPSVTAALITALADGDAGVRQFAVFALSQQSDVSELDVSRILTYLADSRTWVRATAARAMGRLGRRASEHIPSLIDALRDASGDVRGSAAEAIRSMGVANAAALSVMKGLTAEPRFEVRLALAQSISGSAQALDDAFLTMLLSDARPEVRAEAYRGLTRQDGQSRMVYGGGHEMPRLLQGLKDSDIRVREAAAEAIEQFADQIAAPETRGPMLRLRGGGGGRRQGNFFGPAPVRGPGILPPQMDASVRQELQTALDTLTAMPDGALENSARIELTPNRIRQALAMFKTVR